MASFSKMPSGGLSHEQNRGCMLYLDHLLVGIEGWLDKTSLRYITCITHIKKVLAAPRNCHLCFCHFCHFFLTNHYGEHDTMYITSV